LNKEADKILLHSLLEIDKLEILYKDGIYTMFYFAVTMS